MYYAYGMDGWADIQAALRRYRERDTVSRVGIPWWPVAVALGALVLWGLKKKPPRRNPHNGQTLRRRSR